MREIEFLNLDDVESEHERSYLYNCVKSDHGNDNLIVETALTDIFVSRSSTARVLPAAVADS